MDREKPENRGKAVRVVQAKRAWVGGEMVPDVVVEIQDGLISSVQVGRQKRVPEAIQADTLLPGLINAHCHLEYCHLRGRMPQGRVSFGDWMSAIVKERGAERGVIEAGMRRGAQELLQGGCTFVIDSTTDGASGKVLDEVGLGHSLMFEVLGLTEERAQEQWSAAIQQLGEIGEGTAGGLNPHAPYSVGPWLQGKLRQENLGVPVAWHLAETLDEEELFLSGTGSIAEVFKGFQLPMPWGGKDAPGCSAFEFMRRTRLLGDVELAFHGNTLSRAEAKFFIGHRALVHCPGTHRWFNRPRFPLRELLDDGVRVCLGTDSLASSDMLSMLELMRIVSTDHPDLTPDEIVAMATSSAGELSAVKGEGPARGQIATGRVADFCLIRGTWETGEIEKVIVGGKM